MPEHNCFEGQGGYAGGSALNGDTFALHFELGGLRYVTNYVQPKIGMPKEVTIHLVRAAPGEVHHPRQT